MPFINSQSTKAHIVKFNVKGTGTAAVSGTGHGLVALTDNGVGDWTLTFSPALSEPPVCIAIPLTPTVNISLSAAPTNSVVRFKGFLSSDGVTAADADFQVLAFIDKI
jgi:hypothetical protein